MPDLPPRYSHPGLYALGMDVEVVEFRADLTAQIRTSRRRPLTPQDVHVLRLRYGLVLDGAEIVSEHGREHHEYTFFGPSRFVVETSRHANRAELFVGGGSFGWAFPAEPPPPKTIWDHILEDS